MLIAGDSVGYLASYLFDLAGIQFDASTWEAELQRLAVNGTETEQRIASLITTLLNLDGSRLTVGENG